MKNNSILILSLLLLALLSAYTGYLKGTVDAVYSDKHVMMVKPMNEVR